MKLVITVLDGHLSTDACVPHVYLGRGTEAYRGSRAKIEASFRKRCIV